MTKPIVLLFSGGIDSTLALHWAHRRRHTIHSLEFEHPARPPGERRAAARILDAFNVRKRHHVTLDVDTRLPARGEGYLATRNLLLHSAAQSVAETIGARCVIAGHVRGDAEEFPDADASYFQAIARLARRGRPGHALIPIQNPLTPANFDRLLRSLPIDLELTWSCWTVGAKPCGRCEKCKRRADLIRRSHPASGAKTPRANRARRG